MVLSILVKVVPVLVLVKVLRMNEYWAKAVSLEGFTQFLPAVTLAMMLNICVILATGRSSCAAAGECV